ncbi:MAG: hypothetical protein JWL81_1267, partial [Verrucomicrobiales bacterium]|nr:hypothetical protein [Verrucomicrobiales bacterium]
LDQFRTAYISTSLEPDEIAMHWSLTYEEKPAILKIYAATGPGTPPAFVPNDVQDVGWGTLDWGQMFDNIKELAIAVSPMAAGGMEMGLGELKKKIGVDIRTDILGQMGDDLWTVSYIDPEADDLKAKDKDEDKPEAQDPAAAFQNAFAGLSMANQSQVVGIALKDSKAFELSLKSIFNTLAPGEGLFEDREFMGKTIHQFKGTPPNLQVAWLIHNDTMMFSVGKPALLDKILAGMDKKPASPLISESYVQAALAKLPPGGVSTSYSNAGQLIDTVFAALKPVMADEAEGEAAEVINNLPDKLNLPWQFVSRMYLGDHAADVRIRLSIKP